MKKTSTYLYEFNIDKELAIYSEIGRNDSSYHNYFEWHAYVCKKYGDGKYTDCTLKNFVHYLKREKNVTIGSKEIWSGCTVPLLIVFITIAYTLVFSVINVINTYNNAINTLIDDEFLQYTGYNAQLIYQSLEQNLYSGMKFYAFGAVIMFLIVLLFINIVYVKIRNDNLKNEFYSDYIMIIQEIIDTHDST